MTTYMKSLMIKRGYSKAGDQKDTDANPIPYLKVDSKDSKEDIVELSGILDKANEVYVEWETCHYGLVITRMVCRTLVWLTFVALLWYVASIFN